MTRTKRTLRRVLAPAALLASLGFGAAQALATPNAAAPPDTCDRRACRDYCAARGAQGSCVGGMCVCYVPAE